VKELALGNFVVKLPYGHLQLNRSVCLPYLLHVLHSILNLELIHSFKTHYFDGVGKCDIRNLTLNCYANTSTISNMENYEKHSDKKSKKKKKRHSNDDIKHIDKHSKKKKKRHLDDCIEILKDSINVNDKSVKEIEQNSCVIDEMSSNSDAFPPKKKKVKKPKKSKQEKRNQEFEDVSAEQIAIQSKPATLFSEECSLDEKAKSIEVVESGQEKKIRNVDNNRKEKKKKKRKPVKDEQEKQQMANFADDNKGRKKKKRKSDEDQENKAVNFLLSDTLSKKSANLKTNDTVSLTGNDVKSEKNTNKHNEKSDSSVNSFQENNNDNQPKSKKKKLSQGPDENINQSDNKSKRAEKYKNKRNRSKKQKLPEKKLIFTFDENHPAIVYLSKWKNDKQNWSFKKSRQTWLLHHMYDELAIPKDHFSILMEYLSGSKGGTRSKTLSEAESFFNENCENENDNNKCHLERCREVIQHLSS